MPNYRIIARFRATEHGYADQTVEAASLEEAIRIAFNAGEWENFQAVASDGYSFEYEAAEEVG